MMHRQKDQASIVPSYYAMLFLRGVGFGGIIKFSHGDSGDSVFFPLCKALEIGGGDRVPSGMVAFSCTPVWVGTFLLRPSCCVSISNDYLAFMIFVVRLCKVACC
jgi:hypothetical protein